MMKSKRFEPIQEIATTSAKDLSRAMGEAGRKVAEIERQIEQLQSYRDEYVRKSGHGTAAVDAVKLQNYRTFLERLGEALHQQVEDRWMSPARNIEKRRARRGAQSASKPNRRIGWSNVSARKSSTPRIGASSAKAMMRRCAYPWRRAANWASARIASAGLLHRYNRTLILGS